MLSLDIARSSLAVHGQERIGRSLAAAQLRAGIRGGGRFRELSERFLASPGVVAVDPLRIVIDTRSGGISGHEARRLLFERTRSTEMATDSVIVAVIGAGRRPMAARPHRARRAPRPGVATGSPIALPEPGPAVVSLREAYFAPAELVPAELPAACRRTRSPLTPLASPTCCRRAHHREVIDFLRRTARSPFGHIRGAAKPELSRMRVLMK